MLQIYQLSYLVNIKMFDKIIDEGLEYLNEALMMF